MGFLESMGGGVSNDLFSASGNTAQSGQANVSAFGGADAVTGGITGNVGGFNPSFGDNIASWGKTAQSVVKPITDIASTWMSFQQAGQMEDYYKSSIAAMNQNISQSKEAFEYNKGIKSDQNATYAAQKQAAQ